jgi:GntR family transcriptional regulator
MSETGGVVADRGTYLRIADELRRDIEAGRFLPGATVPSELSLSEQYGVARGTIRAALALLADENLIEGRAAAGGCPARLASANPRVPTADSREHAQPGDRGRVRTERATSQ